MIADEIEVQLSIKDMWFNHGEERRRRGNLYAATPSAPKPAELSMEAWAVAVLRAASRFGKFRLVIPTSFYPGGLRGLPLPVDLAHRDWIELMDLAPSRNDFQGDSPLDSLRPILRALEAGETLLVPSLSETISGFVPLILARIYGPHEHVVKVWYPVLSDGYELSEFHMGYLYGLTDGVLEARRREELGL